REHEEPCGSVRGGPGKLGPPFFFRPLRSSAEGASHRLARETASRPDQSCTGHRRPRGRRAPVTPWDVKRAPALVELARRRPRPGIAHDPGLTPFRAFANGQDYRRRTQLSFAGPREGPPPRSQRTYFRIRCV